MTGARRLVGLVGAAVLVVALLGVATGWWLARDEPPGESSVDVGFARDMGVHHDQAVELAELVRDRTDDPTIRQLARDIALTQQAQIGELRGWLDVWGRRPTSVGPPMQWMDHPAGEPFVRRLARGMVEAQSAEIDEMTDLLADGGVRYGDAEAP